MVNENSTTLWYKVNRCWHWFVAPMQLARKRNVNCHSQFVKRVFGFVWWNFCVVAIILFCLQQRKLWPNLCRIERRYESIYLILSCQQSVSFKRRCNYFCWNKRRYNPICPVLPSQRSLPVTAKRSERSTKWWFSMSVLLPMIIFISVN